ncbi:Zinc finger CCHC-type protein [Dioscorea alata]|uniref:Zinc finger CCHC-type protein n=1 Tax=Dioscorea alata TaxID=55571 RepID=A0ACB7WJV2_DIOAL|nr:Zinc finger CCHC-type protein [Dioscorea alata]
MVLIIEETKDISSMKIQELMGSLMGHERRLARHAKKSVESAFQSKLNITPKIDKGGESSRGGRYVCGRGRGRNLRGKGRNIFPRTFTIENFKSYNICGKDNHLEKDCWHKDKPKYHHCKKFGHIEKYCRLKGNQQAHFFKGGARW